MRPPGVYELEFQTLVLYIQYLKSRNETLHIQIVLLQVLRIGEHCNLSVFFFRQSQAAFDALVKLRIFRLENVQYQ